MLWILKDLEDDLQCKHEELIRNSTRKISYELPITGWLHDHLKMVLNPQGFVVDTQSKVFKPTAPTNEYINSHPDLLVYHSRKFVKKVKALYVTTFNPKIDILCTAGEEEDIIDDVK